MDQSLFKYEIVAEDPKTHARAGILHTPHGDIETPIFMPVGTKANVKGIPTETVKDLGAQIVLANTYHLAMRPGADTVAELGGLHDFMNWHGPILTDSGGFQIFSHSDAVKLTDEGVRFIATDYDGSHVFWTPEDNMEITETVKDLGAQIVLANTYHLAMRPGADTVAELGGLHDFMNWHGPILTDSGGFQIFSHSDAVKLTDEGVRFIATDYDGSHVFWTPEDNMEIAMKLGSDICMQLDQCPG